jgi:cell division septation protein DedD
LAVQTSDDGFHEIQLNGKQLVFLFMAATVVSVVIFLCGVLVGRGVRVDRAGAGAELTEAAADLRPAVSATPAEPAAGSDPTAAVQPPSASEDLRYFDRLEGQSQPAERLARPAPREEPGPPTAAPDAVADAAPVAAAAPRVPAPAPRQVTPQTPPAPAVAAATSGQAAAPGFAVQVAALNSRSEADAMAKRLSAKGYAVFVMAPVSGTPTVYRVRVGPFKTRREADSVAVRLEKEEQFKPWVAR